MTFSIKADQSAVFAMLYLEFSGNATPHSLSRGWRDELDYNNYPYPREVKNAHIQGFRSDQRSHIYD